MGASTSRQMVQKTLWATADPVCLHMFGAFQKRLCLCTTPAPLDRNSHHLDVVVAWLNKERSRESCKASISMTILSLKMSVSAENTALLLAMTVYNSAYNGNSNVWYSCECAEEKKPLMSHGLFSQCSYYLFGP